DRFVMDALDHHLAWRDRFDDGGADRLLAHALGKAADHVERDVSLKQRAAHLAHRSVDVGLRQRAAPRQPIEDATKLFRQIVEQCRCPLPSSYPAKAGYPVLRDLAPKRTISVTGSPAFAGDDTKPNTFAPEGASRCRALASGLQGRAAGRKERLSDERAG